MEHRSDAEAYRRQGARRGTPSSVTQQRLADQVPLGTWSVCALEARNKTAAGDEAASDESSGRYEDSARIPGSGLRPGPPRRGIPRREGNPSLLQSALERQCPGCSSGSPPSPRVSVTALAPALPILFSHCARWPSITKMGDLHRPPPFGPRGSPAQITGAPCTRPTLGQPPSETTTPSRRSAPTLP